MGRVCFWSGCDGYEKVHTYSIVDCLGMRVDLGLDDIDVYEDCIHTYVVIHYAMLC